MACSRPNHPTKVLPRHPTQFYSHFHSLMSKSRTFQTHPYLASRFIACLLHPLLHALTIITFCTSPSQQYWVKRTNCKFPCRLTNLFIFTRYNTPQVCCRLPFHILGPPINRLAPNDVYICRTAQLTSRRCITSKLPLHASHVAPATRK